MLAARRAQGGTSAVAGMTPDEQHGTRQYRMILITNAGRNPVPRPLTTLAAALALTASTVTLTACTPNSSEPHGIQVATAVYPLEFVAESIVGDAGTVISLVDPAVEPHDVELSPAAVRRLGGADLVLTIGGFQPAVDAAVVSTGATTLDATAVLPLHADAHNDAHNDAETTHAIDPHFWLDPTLLATYAQAVGDALAAADPAHAAQFQANTATLIAHLTATDAALTEGLATCARHDIVVSHEAFGYLARRYGLTQLAIAGLDPDTEPSPARLLQVRDAILATGATTVFAESSATVSAINALAADAGVQTAILSPVETAPDGGDYLTAMDSNLQTLRSALSCE